MGIGLPAGALGAELGKVREGWKIDIPEASRCYRISAGAIAPQHDIRGEGDILACIAREDAGQPEVIELLRASDALMAELYPAESNHLLDVSALQREDVAFFVAREAGVAIGCGAWVRRDDSAAELKRMFVTPAARGHRLGRALLQAIEADAQRWGMTEMRLETGALQPEALGLYRSSGYLECAAFAPYEPDPLSVFMEKVLG